MNMGFIGAAADGGRGGDDTDMALFGGFDGSVTGVLHHTGKGNRELPGKVLGNVGTDGTAGCQNHLDLTGEQKVHILLCVAQDGFPAFGAIGNPPGISKIDDILMGKEFSQLLDSGQSSQAGIKHADGTVEKFVCHAAIHLLCWMAS